MSKRARSNSSNGNPKKKQMLIVHPGVRPAQLTVPGYTRNVGTYGRFVKSNCCNSPGELKWYDIAQLYAITPVSLSKSVLLQSFNTVPQGTGPNERIGQRIRIKKLGFNFSIWLPAGTVFSNVVQSHLVRLILVCDKQNNGLGFGTADLLWDAATPIDPSAQAFRNLTNSGRFHVLSDTRYNLNYEVGGGDAVVTNVMHVGQKLISGTIWKDMDLPVEFSAGGTGALAEIRSNNLAMVMVLETLPLGGTGGVSMLMQSRIRYED